MAQLRSHVALVTGASSGIGAAVARSLALEGASIVLAARREDRLEKLRGELEEAGVRAIAVETDVTDRAACERLVEHATSAFGRLDIVVNNAGIMPLSFAKNVRLDEWIEMVDVNVKGVLHVTAAALPVLLDEGQGHIVNISSVAGRRVFPGGSVYCGTKHFVTAFSEGLRLELAPRENIRVTCIEPGAVATELAQRIADPDFLAASQGGWDFKLLQSEDIAEAVRYAVTAPEHVDVAEILVMPRGQKM